MTDFEAEPSQPTDHDLDLGQPQYVIKDSDEHTMLKSLYDYVQKKMHQDVRTRKWSEIVVRGIYARKSPARLADCESKDKISNRHRPTTTILSPDVLAVNCFPGVDYTEHYASLIATYLALSGNKSTVVRRHRPTASQCSELFMTSNLRRLGPVDIVVIGYNYQLASVRGQRWEGREYGDDLFSWQKQSLPNGKIVAYLTCPFSFWGEISGHLVRALHQFGQLKYLLYLGKAGTLRPDVNPNDWLVSGQGSYIGKQLVTWENALGPECSMWEEVLTGNIITVDSPLCESFEWLANWQPIGSWVDCEVGHIAQACQMSDVKFGYLHIVSDRVSGSLHESESLANEHIEPVRCKRRELFDIVESMLNHFLRRIGTKVNP